MLVGSYVIPPALAHAGVADLTFGYGPAGAGWVPRAGNWDGH